MGSPSKNSTTILPNISKKLAYRTLALVIFVGALVYGLEWFLKYRSDLKRLAVSDTVGWIAAIEYLPDGQEAVLISPDGKIHQDPGYKPHTNDRDITWSPRGNFLFFVSDREEKNYNLFRWSPGSEDPAERRTIGSRARSNPKFPAQWTDPTDGDAKALLTSGGLVQEFDPSNQSTEQILPPTSKEITQAKSGDETGTEGQFEGVYGNLGTSFRVAQWCAGGKCIAAVMRRESGEVLIVQEMQPVDGKFPPPRPITAGEHVDFAINPKDGNIVYSVQGFQWPQTPAPTDDKGKPLPKPFVNAVVAVDVNKKTPELLIQDAKMAFGPPAINADGSGVAVVVGPVDNGSVKPQYLLTLPATPSSTVKRIRVPGDIHEPCWSPDGQHLVFALRSPSGKRSIFDLRLDDSSARDVTGDSGDFGYPLFSPQQKTGG